MVPSRLFFDLQPFADGIGEETDLTMSGGEVLEYEHVFVAFESMDDHDKTSLVAVFVDGEAVQMLEHGLCTVFPIEGNGFTFHCLFSAPRCTLFCLSNAISNTATTSNPFRPL